MSTKHTDRISPERVAQTLAANTGTMLLGAPK